MANVDLAKRKVAQTGRLRLMFAVIGLFILGRFASGAVVEWDAGAQPKLMIEMAQFVFYTPDAEKTLRGVILLVPGRDVDGRGMIKDADWQQAANETKFGLMACHFKCTDKEYQNDPTGELSRFLDGAIDHLAKQAGHPELSKAPLALWGHSAGSNISGVYSLKNPRRVIGVVSIKGPSGPGDFSPPKGEIPYLVALGQKDKPEWVSDATKCYEKGRAARAAWALALNPNEGHEEGKTKAMAIPFLKGSIAQRLGAASAAPAANSAFAGFTTTTTGSSPSGSSLKRLDEKTIWLGNPDNTEICPSASYTGVKSKAACFPDEASAKAWQAYLR